MAKTLVFLVGCIAVCSSAQAEYDFRISEDNEAVTFTLQNGSSITLAFWTSDTNASFNFEVGNVSLWKDDWYYLSMNSPIKPKMWHFLEVLFRNSTACTIPYGALTLTNINSEEENLTLHIKSAKKIYWHQCLDYFTCYLPGPVGYTEPELVISAPTSCVLITLIIALAVYFTRGKKSAIEEPEAKEGKEPAIKYEVVPEASVSHENINWTQTRSDE